MNTVVLLPKVGMHTPSWDNRKGGGYTTNILKNVILMRGVVYSIPPFSASFYYPEFIWGILRVYLENITCLKMT